MPLKKSRRIVLLVGTRKGAFFFYGDPQRRSWKVKGPHFLGATINHLVLDPRDGKTLLVGAKTGHLGPTVFRSTDWGKKWKEAKHPPAFAKTEGGSAVKNVFWLTPGPASKPGSWYAGTVPHGIFRSENGGNTWTSLTGFEEALAEWMKVEGLIWDTPDGAITHSIRFDPRRPEHLYVGLSTGGFFESPDGGTTWKPLNKGVAADFLPQKNLEFGHDPHCVVVHPANPDRLYQQNHCGLYRLDRPSDTWIRIGRNMPKGIGDIGFPVVVHPRDPGTAWVFPMDGTEAWPRTSPGGKPALYVTRNAGETWKRQDKGLPRQQGWFTVRRQCICSDSCEPVGLYFGTTGGELWASRDEGSTWSCVASHLPTILSVEVGMRG